MSSRFNILQESPHDRRPPEPPGPAVANSSESRKWVPSRYNVRAKTEDGRMVLWNTFRGTMSVFQPEQRSAVEMLLSKKGFESRAEGVVKYLHDRGFLIEDGVNEMRLFQLAFGQQHYRTDMLQFFLLASEDCNFRCDYCYEEFARGTMLPWVRTGVKNLVLKRIGSLRHLAVSWFGGEPLYGFKAIEDLAPFFVEVAEKHGVTLSNYMTTNAYLLTPEVAEKLFRWQIKGFQITIDGPPETHNKNRPTRDGGETFATIFNNLRALSKRPDDFSVNIRVNFDRNNYPKMDGFLDLVSKEFRDDPRFRLSFHAVGRWGGPNDPNLEVCGSVEAPQVKMMLQEAANERGIKVGGNLKEVTGPGAQVCYAGRPYNFVIGASGKIMKCTLALDMKDYNVVGHLTEDGEMQIDRDKMALWTEPAFENDTKCGKCVLVPTCQGLHCPMVRIEHNTAPCPPTRMNLKKELLQVQEFSERKGARKVHVHRSSVTKELPTQQVSA